MSYPDQTIHHDAHGVYRHHTVATSCARRAANALGVLLLAAGTAFAQSAIAPRWTDLGHGLSGSTGVPRLSVTPPVLGKRMTVLLEAAEPHAPVALAIGVRADYMPVLGGVVVPSIDLLFLLPTDGEGRARLTLPFRLPSRPWPGAELYVQAGVLPPSQFALSHAYRGRIGTQVGPDFDGDGHADVAVGVPFEDLGGQQDAGAVNVIYGSPAGLDAARNQFFHQDSPGTRGVAVAGDRFGSAMAHGDFNGDGYTDLAVGVPGQDRWGNLAPDSGEVDVLFGGPGGLTMDGYQILTGRGEDGDGVGSVLVAGDFNDDGYSDLAIGIPGEDFGHPLSSSFVVDAGAVIVYHGSATGIVTPEASLWDQSQLADLEAGDRFGEALVAGDFNGDGVDDLAIGVPYEDVEVFDVDLGCVCRTYVDAGAVHVLFSDGTGLSASGHLYMHQGADAGDRRMQYLNPRQSELLGFSLAAADFDNDGRDDLAIGVPGEGGDFGLSLPEAGAVLVVDWDFAALISQRWLGDLGGETYSHADDHFGWTVLAADFNGDGWPDLAAGSPREDVQGVRLAGAVDIIYGTAGRLDYANSQYLHQDKFPGFSSTRYDHIGDALGFGDFDGDGAADLMIGASHRDTGGSYNAGGAYAVYGDRSILRLNPARVQYWHQGAGIADQVESPDYFGRSFAR